MKRTALILIMILMLMMTAAFGAVHTAAFAQPDDIANIQGGSVSGVLEAYAADISSADSEENAVPDALAPDGEVAEDGINTNVATVWIIVVCTLTAGAIFTLVIILAKKNKASK